jgi:RNA polymerase sigma-70 factor (ECF subfamily)
MHIFRDMLRVRQVEVLSEPDTTLVSRIKSGDQFAVKELFRRYYSSLCRFTYKFIYSKEDVEDIVEGIFEKLWINRDKLDPSQPIKGYLFKSVRNQALDFLKNRKNRNARLGDEEYARESDQDPMKDLCDKDLAIAIQKAIERLPKKCRIVFTLNRQDGLTYSEIASVLEISEKTVENQIIRALKHLRKDLREYIG